MKKSVTSELRLAAAGCALLLCSVAALAQTTATAVASATPESPQQAPAIAVTQFIVRGTIKAGVTPLPGVTVTASNTLTGKKVSAATAPDGSFALTLPSRGRYVIKAEQAAFAPTTKEVVITPETPQATVDADLMLASRAQMLAAQQQQGAQQIAAALANRGMQSLSVTESDNGGIPNTDTSGQTGGLPLNGAGADAPTESVSVSGAMGQAQNFGMNPDELEDRIQEIRERIQAEGGGGGNMVFVGPGEGGGFGGPGGGPRGGPGGGPVLMLGGRMMGRFNVNQPHGSIFYSTNNSIFDAAPFQINGLGSSVAPTQKSDYAQHRFGVTIGSPLKIPHIVNSEKTFVFLNWTGGRNENPYDNFSTVPTSAERQGDFSGLGKQLIDPTTGQPLPGNQIASINPSAQALLKFIPLPNLPGAVNNFHYVTSLQQNNDQIAIRLIHNFGEGATFMPGGGRGGRGGRRLQNNINFNLNYSDSSNQVSNPFPTLLGTTQSSGINTGIGWVASKNRITNNLHFNYNRSHSHLSNLFQDSQNIAALAGINGVSQDPFNYGVPTLVFNNFQTVNDTGGSLINNQTFSWSDSVIWRRGKHNLRVGGDFRRIYNDIRSAQNARGSFTFNDSGTFPGSSSGYDFANFLLGLPAQTSIQGGSATYNFRQNSWDLFLQDDWRVTGSLSLNLGLRYEYVSPFSEANNRIVNLDLNPTITAAIPVLPGSSGPFTGEFPITVVEPDRNNFAPRVGFAWRPMKKTVVRGGYGVNYNTGQYGSIVQNLAFQPPFAFTETNVSSTTQVLTLENGFPPPASNQTTNNFAVDKNYKLGYVQIWNLNIQREITPSLLLNLGYNGSKGTDLDMERAPNRLPDGRLRIADVQPFILETSQGDSILHAATVQLRKRMRHGMAAQGTYVFSKSIDNASSIGGGAVIVAQNDLDLAAERGLSSFDQRHKFTGNFTYELPFGTGKKWLNNNGGWLENAFGDWLWSGNFTVASGFPFTPRVLGASSDISQGLNGTLRANIVGDPYSGTCPNGFSVGTIQCWFNTSAFAVPVAGTFGDARRNSIIGPGQFTFGMSVSKTLLAKDTRALELRVSANNVFNHPEYTSIGTILGTPTYGQVVAAGSMRTVNLSARYRF